MNHFPNYIYISLNAYGNEYKVMMLRQKKMSSSPLVGTGILIFALVKSDLPLPT